MRPSRTDFTPVDKIENQVKPSAPAKPRRLHDAINAYCANHSLDEAARGLLDRLADGDDAATAFRRLQLRDQRDEMAILTTCIQADQLFRTFPRRIKKAEKTLALAQVERLDRAVATLREFVEELVAKEKAPPEFDWLSAVIPSDDTAAMKKGLYFIAQRIKQDRRVAKEELLRFGVTRKKGRSSSKIALLAKQNAASGFLAEGVRRVTGKAHLGAVRKIAEVILDTEELSEDRVRNAARLRDREWRHR
jgi:hypothetical protein